MTILAEPSIIRYSYSAIGDYSFSFKVFETTDVKIRHTSLTGIVSSPWILDSDYTITLVDGGLSGGVCHITKVETGFIDIYRDLPLTQETNWENHGPFNADILENDLDRCIMLIQEFEDTISNITRTTQWRGNWVTASVYVVGDIVTSPDGNLYYCIVTHTAGVFATDLATAYWQLMMEISAFTGPSRGISLTVATGIITIPHNNDGRYYVWAEGSIADDLSTILGPVDRDYIIHLYAADAPITIINGAYIHLNGGLNCTLPVTNGVLTLISMGSGTGNQQWLEVSRSVGV